MSSNSGYGVDRRKSSFDDKPDKVVRSACFCISRDQDFTRSVVVKLMCFGLCVDEGGNGGVAF